MIFCSQEDLYKILKAYTIHNPRDGYCQAMAPIAAVLLMHMPAEQAFWCFVSICEKYVQGYYSPGLVWSALFFFKKFDVKFKCKLQTYALPSLRVIYDIFIIYNNL